MSPKVSSRRAKAVPVDELMRYFRVPLVDLPVDYPGREMMLQSRISNISISGVFVRTSAPLPVGTVLEVAFKLPGAAHHVHATTLVRWAVSSREARRGEPAGMGLEFVDLSRRDQASIERFVRAFIERIRK